MTTRAAVLAEIETRLRATGRAVERNPALPGSEPAGGKIFMADGDPGEPESTISVPVHTYTHLIPVEVAVPGVTHADRLALVNTILGEIADEFPASDVDLGGIADEVELLAPRVKGIAEADGFSPEILLAAFTIRVIYTTSHSLAV